MADAAHPAGGSAPAPPGVAVASPALSGGVGPTRLPKVIGGFELISKLGQGAMGAVFEARQVSMDRVVALKLLAPALAKDRDFIERFQREARASALIAHHNLVQGIDVGQDAATGLWYFAMEHVPGEPLSALLRRLGRLDERQALTIARDVANGLAAAHRAGLVHRDIKPDNVMLTPGRGAKILDLGLAKLQQDDTSQTQSGTALGTPLYMAPEQARGDLRSVNASTDLYALGATLFHLIAGRPPFEGQTSAVVLAQHLTKPAPKLDQVAPETSHATSALVARMLAKDQDQRPTSAGEVVKRIDDILAGRVSDPGRTGRSAHATQSARPRGEGRPSPLPSSRLPLLLVTAGAVVVVVLAQVMGGGPRSLKPPTASSVTALSTPLPSVPAQVAASAPAKTPAPVVATPVVAERMPAAAVVARRSPSKPVELDLATFTGPAESAKLIRYDVVAGRLSFFINGTIVLPLRLDADGDYVIAISAACDEAEGQKARFSVTIDGQTIGGEITCTVTEARIYQVNAPGLKAGNRMLAVAFLNDIFRGGHDLNLFLHGVTVRPGP